MAQRVVSYVVYTDDLTGEEFAEGDGETVAYGFDGATYEIDLTKDNAAAFRELIAPYQKVSRKTVDDRGRVLKAGGGPGTRRNREEMAKIREWGRANGYDVPEGGKGRLPWGMVQAYDRAHRQ